ncbi:dynein heavy chain 5, axonemal [Trichonephila clavipes]|nr:dynein heavy chain 5, axonemal [Trichonephila clavipes]
MEQDRKLTDKVNEARDNVKYLQQIEKICEKFYENDIEVICKSIPLLISEVQMIHAISRFYHTPEHITSFFTKVTNQIVAVCKNYITDSSKFDLWTLPRKTAVKRMKKCIALFKQYKRDLEEVRKGVSSEIGKRNFEFFQVPVLGTFHSFCKRLSAICEMFATIDELSVLHKCHAEGIEVHSSKLNSIVNGIKAKTYDLLDHRKMDFDTDYKEFKNQISELKMYNKRAGTSKLLKPPFAEKIAWARVLFKRIETPMELLKPHLYMLHPKDQARVVQTYNILAEILLEYMILHHNTFCRKVKDITKELQKSILISKSSETAVIDWEVNFTDTLYFMLKDSQSMIELQLNIPDEGKFLLSNYDMLMGSKVKMQELLNKFKITVTTTPPIFEPLVAPVVKRVECALRPGATFLQWLSTKIDDYMINVKKTIENLEFVIWKASDTDSTRLNKLLNEIQEISLFKLPDVPCDPEDFIGYVENICKTGEETLNFKCVCFDKIVDELISFLLEEGKLAYYESINVDLYGGNSNFQKSQSDSDIGSGDKLNFEGETETLLEHYDTLLAKALGKSAKKSLDTLADVFRYSGNIKPILKLKENSKRVGAQALFLTYLTIQDDTVSIDPSMMILQNSLNDGVSAIQTTLNNVALKREKDVDAKRPTKPLEPGDDVKLKFHRRVLDLSDAQRSAAFLDTAAKSIQPEISKVYKIFLQFKDVWASDREKQIQKFMESNPFHDVYELKCKLEYYEALEKSIFELPYSYTIAGIELQTNIITESLLKAVRKWFTSFGSSINRKYCSKMNEISDFVTDKQKIINLPIQEIGDVQRAMNCFETVQENYIDIDMQLEPIKDAYALLLKFSFPVDFDEVERAKSLPKLLQKREVANELAEKQFTYLELLKGLVETFKTDVIEFNEDYQETGPMAEGITPEEASDRVDLFADRLEKLYDRYESYREGEELFALPISEYPILTQTKKDMVLLQKLFTLFNQAMKKINGYYEYAWKDVDVLVITEELADFQNKCLRLPKGCKEWSYFAILKQRIEDFKETCPLLTRLRNEAMTMNHWHRIEKVCNHKFDEDQSNWTLGTVMEAPLLVFKDDVEDICIAAEKEKEIEAKLEQIFAEWALENLFFSSFKNRGELLLKGTEAGETVVKLEDGLMTLGSLLSNRYSAAMKDIILKWLHYLTTATEVIENWLIVQNLWVYLEAVFVGGDIAKQLPKEAERFAVIDSTWVKLMERAHEKVNVIKCCSEDDTMSKALPHLLEELEACQKSLVGYLESKRRIFPRFFFISDPALLEILGQASDSHTIQAHLLGVFENVFKVKFDPDDYNKITAVISKEGDEIPLDRPVRAEGNVELWLGDLLVVQQSSLNTVIKAAYKSLNEEDFDLITFIDQYIAQVSLLGIQILWTRDGEESLTYAKSSKKIMTFTNKKFAEILRRLIAQTTLDLSKFVRIKYETLITIHVHQKDIFDDLVKMKIKTPSDFEWLKQARFYYFLDEGFCLVKITDVDFVYQNEFLGCTDRLVITPLTDRCYITLAQALGMSMGGAPAGPAGTGKTETTKDMGKALGKYVVVFNCSDQMDFRGLGRIYKGLAQSGSWGCFDEFNRIELPVLSVAAQQISIVLSARKERKEEFVFSDGDILGLNPEFGLFITMNPGYAGRQELPENLKVLFRSVAMMVPDRQVHYDFGLRNILSVLRTLGAQKRSRPEESESSIVMSVLSAMNISKLVDEDEPLFESLINDLFPGITKEAVEYDDLQIAIARQVKAANLINHPSWNLKVIQLYETQMVRHGMMALGPSGAGKTCCIRILMRAMTDCGAPHKEMRMNPKAITASQMFGRLDVATNDWTDGIFSTLWRRTLKTKKDEHVWLILDGPVDAIWIENLNSVLDDNKTLTLANGDRIPMSPTCKIIFEPHNIDNASPATVSRNGMVYMSSSGLHWEPILEGWLSLRTPTEATILRGLFGKVFGALSQYMLTSLIPKMELLQCNYIKQAMDLLDGLLPTDEDISTVHYERLFIFALMWSFGALLELDDRSKMEIFLVKHRPKLDLPIISPTRKETIFEYLVDSEGNWLHWSNRVEEYIYPTESIPTFSSILVPNVDNVRTNFLIDTIQKQQKSVLLIGEQGTAKTVMIKGYLNSLDAEEYTWKNLSFSSATMPEMFQRAVESIVEKKVGTTYGPPGGKKLTIFIDDINMPEINEWGDQVTNEIVRQLMENKGFYSLDKPGDFSTIMDIRFIAAMIQPGGGRNDIPSRLKRQFSVFNCTLPAATSIDKIFGIIGCGYFCAERFSQEIVEFVSVLVPATRILWQETKVKMLPTPAKFHYVFNLRDLSRIWEGMLKIKKEECSSKEDILALWKHECTRVIADRFTNDEDKDWFLKRMGEVVVREIGEKYLELIPEEPYFVNFLRDPPEPEDDDDEVTLEMPLVYEQVPSFEELSDRLNYFMHQYNEASQRMQMDLVFFKDAMVHLVKISRILSTPQGSALLVGVGGSGKQSLTRLAASIYKHEIFQIILTRSYNAGNLVDDLKFLYKTAGEAGKGVTFIFTDNEIKEESFLEYLNTILGSGEVANLFPKDEMREILENLLPVMKKEFPKREPTQDNLYDYFLSRSRANLHIVLCFSPAGGKFQKRSLKFPGLISGCTMDWLTSWPTDALIAVSTHFIRQFDIECSAEVKLELVSAMGIIHDTVSNQCNEYFQRYRRLTYVTPKSYLAFINGYKAIYTEQKTDISGLALRINSGLTKLQEATVSVNELKVDLALKEKELVVASAEVEEVVIDVKKKTESAETIKNSVQIVKDRAQKIVDKISVEKAIAEEKLEAARPALEAAEAALLNGAISYHVSGLSLINSIRDQNFSDIWIPTDSQSSIHHLSNWPSIGDSTNRSILHLFQQLSDRNPIHLQCIPSHVGLPRNEVADDLVQAATSDPVDPEDYIVLTSTEIYSSAKELICRTWTIKPADIATVRKLPKPPHLIMRIMDCVLILFQYPLKPVIPDPERPCPTPSWEVSLKIMSSGAFLNNLQVFPKDNINDEMVELMEPYITMADYTLESAIKTCGQVAGLLSWTLAMASFFAVNKEVLPLKANLALLEAQNAKASKELAVAQAELDEKQAELDVVNAIYNEAMTKKQDLEDSAEMYKRKMIAAEALIAGLQGEKARWTEDSKRFQSQINRLVGDAILLAAFLSYSGPFNQEFRSMLYSSWRTELETRKIPHTESLNLIDSLTDAPTIAEWGVQGLPNDELSLQNGIIVTKSERYPLLIDPQGQGKSWIIKKEEKNQLIVCKTIISFRFMSKFL